MAEVCDLGICLVALVMGVNGKFIDEWVALAVKEARTYFVEKFIVRAFAVEGGVGPSYGRKLIATVVGVVEFAGPCDDNVCVFERCEGGMYLGVVGVVVGYLLWTLSAEVVATVFI